MREYLPRVVDSELDELLAGVPAVVIEGPRAVGKTATATRRAATIHQLDEPGQRAVGRADPARLIVADEPVLIDEWQRIPETWDLVRRAVDVDPRPGRFLLTGSAVGGDLPTHSGAGRIVTLRMRPLTLTERGVGRPSVSLRALLSGGGGALEGSTDVSFADYVREIEASGLPGLRGLTGRALRAQLDGYIDRTIEHDFIDLGLRIRNPGALRRWLTAYAAASSTTASLESIRDAATGGQGEKPARSTILPYVDVLTRMWLLEPVPAWLPGRPIRRLAAAPKHQLADPGLAARLLGVGADAFLAGRPPGASAARDATLLGALFESLATLSVRVFAQAAEATVAHLRTKGGEHEVDLVVERADGRVLAMEVKLTYSVADDDVRHLLWLRDRLGDDLVDAVVLTTGADAYRRRDGVAVVPLALLGP